MRKLLHGDCLEVMKTIPDKSVDMCLTDPPYGTTACKWDHVIPFAPMWEQLHRIVKDNGAICLFGSEPFSSALRMSNINRFKYDWVWHKNRPSGLALAKYQPMRTHEIVSVFSAGRTRFFPIKERRDLKDKYASLHIGNGKRKGYSAGIYALKETAWKALPALRNPTTVKKFDSVSNHGGKVHPTQKPVALLEYLIKTYTLEGETVLDFTMGSGSTGVACVNLNRKFIGIEKDDKYFEIAKDRISSSISNKPMI